MNKDLCSIVIYVITFLLLLNVALSFFLTDSETINAIASKLMAECLVVITETEIEIEIVVCTWTTKES